MRKNVPVTNRENDYPASMRIVSTTDLDGTLQHCNDDFCEIAGFDHDELIGQPHNLIRHPDMPPAAFADLWGTVKAGKSWMGIVKNRCKNGDHYWVDAFVAPVMEGKQVIGYQSVRLKPAKINVSRAEALYRSLWGPASIWQSLRSRMRPGLMGKSVYACLLTAAATLAANAAVGAMVAGSLWPTFAALGTAVLAAIICASLLAAPWKRAAAEARRQFDNPVATGIYTGRHDELGQLQALIQFQKARLETVIWRIADTSGGLSSVSGRATAMTRKTAQDMDGQMNEVEQVATAMNEMAATVQEVARNASATATAARDAESQVDQGSRVVEDTVHCINRLASEVSRIESVIGQLSEQSQHISTVVEVIRSIADQTNLLALNAAIEAARAGEQGRGFAVVADEVRSLAARTQTSTEEIQNMIQGIQNSSGEARDAMAEGRKVANESVERANAAGEALTAIRAAVSTAMEMTMQIATAAEEQSVVSEEIDSNVGRIYQASQQTREATNETREANEELAVAIQRLDAMTRQFGS
ncbi:PAS domain-containing methyl-accepting chemotaxis protein [Allohahella marinimesophila]|uniref:PAS domain-containing methyl-accepting chemotaxis protein n=1 Tax=Allohahella marinimesophila TaxID=1054972 RepID=A0ABP7PM52_9GAMM